MERIKYPCFSDYIYKNEHIEFYPLYKTSHFEYISADTETKLYYNGKLLTEDEAYILNRDNGQSWIKTNIEVKCYAFTISSGKGFALFSNVEDFLTACAMLNVKYVLWYNARFDFSIFDYYFLSNGWEDTTYRIKELGKYQHLPDKTYTSLNGEFGQRYQMQVWKSYLNRNSKKVTRKFKMIDICNISGGGLAKNLEDWDIRDEDNNPIRKLTMDYVSASIESDLPYMIADVKGLFYLGEKIDKTLKEITGFSLLDGEYLTAGGLAIKTLLKFMYNQKEFRNNKNFFKTDFPMSEKLDKKFRDMHLYLGGKCLVNPEKIGRVQRCVYKYDVNSMYPNQMRNMLYPYGRAYYSEKYNENDNRIKVMCISKVCGIVKENKIPIFQDFHTKNFEETLFIPESFLIWEEELKELELWYDLSYNIDYVLYYKAKRNDGAIKFVDTFYDIKCNSKGAVKNGAKLELNSSYGKLAQRIERVKGSYKMTSDGYVHFEKSGVDIDTKSMLSVLVGSRITSLARTSLMRYIREICHENVKDNFIYCDTDSVHALTEYTDTDDKALGKMKNEGVFRYALYLAPKSYLMLDYNGKYEVHCKGVNTKVVENEIKNLSFIEATNVFTANRTFKTLCGINCKGGKALIYMDKMILNDENYVCDTTCIVSDNIYYELGG